MKKKFALAVVDSADQYRIYRDPLIKHGVNVNFLNALDEKGVEKSLTI